MKSTSKYRYHVAYIFVIAAVTATIGLTQVFAATGTMYLRASSSSLKKGQSVTVSVRINPGTTVDSVQGTVSYDASKLQLLSVNTSGSAFSTELSSSASGGSINFARGDFGAGVKSDALIQSMTFKALVGSGAVSLGLNGANASKANSGSFTNPGTSGTSISFYTPAPAPSPTPKPTPSPNPTPAPSKPSNGTSSGGSSSSGSSGSSSNKPSTPNTNGGGSSSSSGGSTRPAETSDTTKTKLSDVKQQTTYNKATVAIKTSEPVTAYLRYGLGSDLSQQTGVSKSSTSHSLSLNPKLLIPGEEYSYVIVTKTKSGKEVSTNKRTIQVKGLTVAVTVTDRDGELLRNAEVTLRSKPQTVRTDENGVATFKNVVPGNHNVVYTADKEYAQPITIANNVSIVDGVATSAVQNFSVTYQVKTLDTGKIVGILLIVLLGGLLIAAIFISKRNGPTALPILGPIISRRRLNAQQTPAPIVQQQGSSASTEQPAPPTYYHNDTVQSQWLNQNRNDRNE